MKACSCGCGARVPFVRRAVNSQVGSVMNLIAKRDAWAQITGQKPLLDLYWELDLGLGRMPDSSKETFSEIRQNVSKAHAYSIGEISDVAFELSKLRSYRAVVLFELGRQIRGLRNLGLVDEASAVRSLGLSNRDMSIMAFGPTALGGEPLDIYP